MISHEIGGPGEREDGAVVVGVAVLVEQRGAGGSGQPAQRGLVASLADIDHALEEHGASVARRQADGAQAPRR